MFLGKKQLFRKSQLAFAALILLFSAVGARADIFDVTIMNATFTATCIGGGTCTEVFNGSGLYDSVARTVSNLSLTMTGTLNVSSFAWGAPACIVPGCLNAPVLYDTGVLPSHNPIEFRADLPTFDAPTPLPLNGGPDGTLLFVPGGCGGDQPLCNTIGAFPGNPDADYQLTSGTYTSVDLGPSPVPEPSSVVLMVTGIGMLGLVLRRYLRLRRSR
jgi:hypothetical protein